MPLPLHPTKVFNFSTCGKLFQLLNFCYFFLFYFFFIYYMYIHYNISAQPNRVNSIPKKNPQIPIMEILGGEFFYYE